MRAENLVAIILIAAAGSLVTYFLISNWWSQTHPTITHGVSCSEELKEFQYNLELSKRQQVESVVMANPTIRKLIDNSSYCEFMGLGTLYTENGSFQNLNINLNDTKELTAQVSLQNSSVVSYELNNLTRTGGPIPTSNFYSQYAILYGVGIAIAAIAITVFLFTRKRK